MTQPASTPTPSPEIATQRPARAARDLLTKLAMRVKPGLTAYVAHMPRGRLVLVLPNELTSRALTSNGVYAMATVRAAEAQGWVTWGQYIEATNLPAFDYDARPGKTGGGYTIAITNAGRTAIGRAAQ